jgi:hypothetical protein
MTMTTFLVLDFIAGNFTIRHPLPDEKPCDLVGTNLIARTYGQSFIKVDYMTPLASSEMARYRLMHTTDPTWKFDPTYNLRRQRK